MIQDGIDMAFHWFKHRNPTLELICDEEVMNDWRNFIQWCFAHNAEGEAERILENSPEIFDFEISKLMKEAIDESDSWFCKYCCDYDQEYEMEYSEECANCGGSGYLDEDHEEECEECDGMGIEGDSDWYSILEADYLALKNEVDTSTFKKLSQIKLD